MLNGYGFKFNGETSIGHNVYVEHRPNMPSGRENMEYVQIVGRDTSLVLRNGEWEDIEISVDCAYKTDKDLWNEKAWEVRRWLRGAGTLTFFDSVETFWKVKDINIKEFTRSIKKYATFRVDFTCDPFEYLRSGKEEMDIKDVKYNPYDISRPVYLITGNGSCILKVNGKTMKATVGQNLTIDTDRMIAYREDGIMMNTSVSGDYEDLYLNPGDNNIGITSGFSLKIIPNWRRL